MNERKEERGKGYGALMSAETEAAIMAIAWMGGDNWAMRRLCIYMSDGGVEHYEIWV